MSRYQPPRAKSSPYITKQGYQRLQDELTYLWKTKRPEVTRKVSEAAALGDRSENAEYIYGKRQLREIDRRVQFLSRRLDELQIIERIPPDQSRVFFGAWVTLADDTGQTREYRIVGPDEFDTNPQYISVDAPLARALIGRSRGDAVTLSQPRQESTPRILDLNQADQQITHHLVKICYKKD